MSTLRVSTSRQAGLAAGKVSRRPAVCAGAQLNGQARPTMRAAAKASTAKAATSSETVTISVDNSVWWQSLLAGVVTNLLPATEQDDMSDIPEEYLHDDHAHHDWFHSHIAEALVNQ